MAITRIKNNQITDATIIASAKVQDNSVTAGKLETNLTYPSNMTITGDLTVNGTTTTINTTNTTVEDPILVLGSQQTGTAALDFGFIGERGTDQNVAFIWDEATDEWVAGYTNSAESATTITVTSYADMHVNNITAEGTLNAGPVSLSSLTVTGTSDLQGAVTAGAGLDVTGTTILDDVTASGTLGVTGASTFSTLSSSGLASLDSVSTTNSVTVGTTLNVSGTSNTNGISNTGAISTGSLSTTGAATIGDTLDVTNAFTASGDVTFDGGAGDIFTITDGTNPTVTIDTATGNTTIEGTLSVTGNSTFGGDIDVTGDVGGATATITGNSTIGGTLGVTGASTLGAVTAGATTMSSATIQNLTNDRVVIVGTGGVIEDDANFTFNGTQLDVGVGNFTVAVANGNTAVAGTLSVNGQATLASANVQDLTNTYVVFAGANGELTDSANLTFDGTALAVGVNLTVAGTTTLDDTVTLTGGAGKSLIVNDGTTTTFSVESSTGNVSLPGTGDLTLTGGDASIGGTLTVTGTTDLNGTTTAGNITIDAASTLDAGGNKWTNLADGTNSTDAVTLQQLTAVTNAGWTISDGTTSQVIAGSDTLTVNGTANEVDVAVTATDTLTIGLPDNVTLAGNLTAVNGTFSGDVDVTGATTLTSLATSGAATLNSASVTTTLGVTGVSTFEDNVIINGGTGEILKVTDAGTQNAVTAGSFEIGREYTITTTGTTDFTAIGAADSNPGTVFTATGVGSGTGTATPTSDATLFSINNENGNVLVGGTLTANGAADLNAGLNVDGATTLDAVTASGNVSVGGTLGVTGNTTTAGISNTGAISTGSMTSTGNVGVGGNLTVTGTSTLTGALTANNTSDFNGAVTMNDITFDSGAVINAGSNLITQVADPTSAQDAATKKYVDDQIAAGGGTFTIAADTGIADSILVGTDTFTIAGTLNEIETVVSTDTITVGLPNDVTIGNNLTVTAGTTTNTLTVSGLSDLNGNLDVLGTSNFTGDMTTGNVTSVGTVDITGQLNIDDLVINGTDISATGGTQITIDPFPAGGDAGGDVIIYGNLQVTGTQTTVNSTVVQINDPMTSLGTTSNTSLDSGTKLIYNDGINNKEAFYGYDISAGEFIFVEDATDTAGVISGALGSAAFGSARVTDLTQTRIVYVGANGELIDSANLTFDGTTLTAGGFATAGNMSVANFTATGTSDLQGAVTAGAGLDVTGATTLDAVTASGTATLNGATTVNNTLAVTGSSTLAGVSATTLSTSSTATLDSLGVTNNATVGGDLGVTGTTNAAAINGTNVNFSGTLNAAGNSTIGGTLGVTGAATFDSNVTINGGTGEIFKVTDGAVTPTDLFVIDNNTGAVTASGTFTANSTSDFNGDVTLGGSIVFDAGANKLTNVADPTANQDAATKAYVDSQVAAGGSTLDIAADSGVDDGVVIGTDTLTISGTASEIETSVSGDTITIGLPDNVAITGTLSSGGAATLNSLGVTNNATVGGTLGVTGATTLTGALTANGGTTTTSLTASGAASMQSTLGVTGITTMAGLLNANGGIAVDGTAFTVADTTGDVATTGSLTVGGTSSFTGTMTAGDIDSSTLDTTGNVTIGGTLGVTGAATFSTDVTISGGVGDTFKITDGAVTPTTLFEVDASTGQVDAAGAVNIGGALDVTGDTTVDNFTIGATSTVSMGSNVVTNVATPVAGTDAANKAYVDSLGTTGWTLSDGTTTQVVQIGDTVTLQGTANEVDVAVSAVDTMTIGLPSDVTIANNLTVTGDVDAATGTIAAFDATTASISGLLTANGGIAVDTTAFTVADTTGNTAIAGTLDVTGATTVSTISATTSATLASAAVSDLTAGRVVLAGTGGELQDNGNLTFDGTLLNVTGNVTASGTVQAATGTITGNATVGGTMGITGNTTVSTGTFTVSTGATSLQTTDVTGVLTVTGSAAIDNVTIDGNDISPTAGTELTINDAGGDYNFRVEGNTDANLLFVDAGTDSVNIGTATALTDVQFQVAGTNSSILSKGTTAERPATGIAGMLRYNTTTDEYEFFDGSTSQWSGFGTEFTVIASETFSGDGTTTAFTLSSSQTTASCIVSINGVVQLPTTAYGVSGTTLTFTEAPATGDTIEVRELTTTTSIEGLSDGTASITTQGSAGLEVTGDLIPAADNTYKLGSASKQWSELHVAGTTIYLGGFQIKNDAGTIKFLESDGVTSAPLEFALDPDVVVDGGTF